MKRSGSKIEGIKGDPLQLDAGETLKKRDLKRLSKQMGNDLNTSSEDQQNNSISKNRKSNSSIHKRKGEKPSTNNFEDSPDQLMKDS